MHCSKCNAHYDDPQVKFCSQCGGQVVADSLQNDTSSGVNINLGDANAISGGLHISNVVHERQKHREEIHQESVVKYKLLCEQVYADGVMTSDEARQLENLRLTLGLPSEEANQIREQIRQLRLNQSQTLLNPMQRMTLQQIVTMARNGKIDLLRSSFPRLEAMAQKYEQFMQEGTLIIMPGTILDMMDVDDDLMRHIEDHGYEVMSFGYDPYNAREFVERWCSENTSWGVEKVIQGVKTESVPLTELKKLAEDRMLIFDEELMSFTMGNCIVQVDTNGNKKLLKDRYEAKIDAVAATMDAFVAYKLHKDSFG